MDKVRYDQVFQKLGQLTHPNLLSHLDVVENDDFTKIILDFPEVIDIAVTTKV